MADSNITKRALATSLKELMVEQPFDKINVAQICERCNMNRKSFYYHFKDKYDLVCSATSFLRNWDSILEKKRANLRSISEPARLRQPPPQKHGSGTRKRAGSKHTGGATNSRPSRAFCPLVG